MYIATTRKKIRMRVLFDELSYDEVLLENLRIMDHSAISLCRENKIPIIVLNIFEKGDITKALSGEKVGTKIIA